MTLKELFDGFFEADGYRNYVPKYCSLLIEPTPHRSESELFSPAAPKSDQASHSNEVAAKEISQLTNRSFWIFECIVANFGKKKNSEDFQTIQIALHEYMFKTLYHLNLNCRQLVQAQVGGPNQTKVYFADLKKKCKLADEQVGLIAQNWFESESKTWEALNCREYRIKVYDDEGGCFQIYNSDLDPVLKIPQGARSSSGLIISKFYFLSQIFRIFMHLQICTQIIQLNQTGNADDADTEFEESDCMKAFIEAANEFFDRDV